MQKINLLGLKLIKEFEGCDLQAYPDPGPDPFPWTIGYGHTKGVNAGMTITEQEAESLLISDLVEFEEAVNKLVHVELNENQFSALVSFCFNCGVANFTKSTLLERLNAGDYLEAADEILKWTRANGLKLSGLVRRRKEERKLFLQPVGGAPNKKAMTNHV